MQERLSRAPTAGRVSARLAQVLLALATLGLGGTLFFWHLASERAELSVDSLGTEQRQALVRELLESSPGIHRSTWFEPRIAYTLQPRREHTAWQDTFTANELGYRTHPVAKPPGALRIVFAGDSWTFGMWVSEAESFPARLEALASERAGGPEPVQSWILALPGYNTFNQIAALETFFDRLRPDAVVLGVTTNDVSSSLSVLPDGSLGPPRSPVDSFDDPWPLEYRGLMTNSFVYLERWRAVVRAIAGLERRLRERSVPLLVFFTGLWDERFAQKLIAESGIDAPYLVTPEEVTRPDWLNPPPMYHGSPRAHAVYARLVYRGLETPFGWAPLEEAPEIAGVTVRHRAELGEEAVRAGDQALELHTRNRVLPRFEPSRDPKVKLQCLAGVDPATGLAGRHAALLMRREAERERLAIRLRRADGGSFPYPMEVDVFVPSARGGTRGSARLGRDGPETLELEVDLPPDVAPGVSFEVIFTAPRATVTDGSLVPRSFYIERIEQL